MTPVPASIEERSADREAAEALFETLPRGTLLLGYQQRTLARLRDNDAKLVVIEKSRRIGLTWALAAYAVLRAAAQPSAGGDHVFYMGYEQEMAREFIDACGMWAKSFAIGASAVGEEVFEDTDAEGNTTAIKAFRIVFASGFKIAALPSMPRAFRGKQGVVIIDEAAFHKALGEKIKAALALLMLGGQVVLVSTHDGSVNPFNLLIDDIRSGKRRGEVITITYQHAIADGFYERRVEMARRRGRMELPKAEFIAEAYEFYGSDAAEELDVIPSAGGGALIKPEDLSACEHDDAGKPELYTGGLVYIGRDIASGRKRDFAIIWAFELVGDVLWLRDRWESNEANLFVQGLKLDELFLTRRVAAAWIDQTGLGEGPVLEAQMKHGSSRVVGQLLTGPNRLDLGISLQQRFERGLIRIPSDPVIRTDLRAIKRASTSGGGTRLVNDDTVHADRFWAAALASRAADLPPALYDYRPVRAGGRSRLDEGRDSRVADFMRAPDDRDDRPAGRFGRGAW